MRNVLISASIAILALTGCAFGETSPEELAGRKVAAALTGDPVTSTVAITFVCTESSAVSILFDVAAPVEVAPGETFRVALHATHDLVTTVAPYSGTWASTSITTATNATPALQTTPWPASPFMMGDRVIDMGEIELELTAGTGFDPIELSIDQLSYALTRDGEATPAFTNECPIGTQQPLLATIAIAGAPEINVPTRPLQCRRFRQYTDDEGNAFASRRACVHYVLAHR